VVRKILTQSVKAKSHRRTCWRKFRGRWVSASAAETWKNRRRSSIQHNVRSYTE